MSEIVSKDWKAVEIKGIQFLVRNIVSEGQFSVWVNFVNSDDKKVLLKETFATSMESFARYQELNEQELYSIKGIHEVEMARSKPL